MSEIEKQFLKGLSSFKNLSLKIEEGKKQWFNLKYLGAKVVRILDNRTQKYRDLINILFRDLSDGEYYRVLTGSFSLIGGLQNVEKGDVINIYGRKMKTLDGFKTQYEVEKLPKSEPLNEDEQVKLKEFLSNERGRKEISEEDEIEYTELDF
jgi:hypothetical protein